MEAETKYWGKKEIAKENILKFTREILAFPDLLHYVLLEEKDTPFLWLQSLEEKEICFILMNPYLVMPDYQPEIEKEALNALQAQSMEELTLYTMVVVPGDVKQMRTNLQAPILVNWSNRLACQTVLTKNDYPVRYYIFDALSGGESNACTDPQDK